MLKTKNTTSQFKWRVYGWVEANPRNGQVKKFWNKFYKTEPKMEDLEKHFKKHNIRVLSVTFEKIGTIPWSKI